MNKSVGKSLKIDEDIELPSALTDPYLYVSMNYPYLQILDYNYNKIPDVPFLASGRLFYIISNKVLGTNIDVRTDFELNFINVYGMYFNTAPILYYAILDLGILFPIFFLIFGIISQKMYFNLYSGNVIQRIAASIWFAILVLSFRGYLLIYLTVFLSILYTLAIGHFIRMRNLKIKILSIKNLFKVL